MRSIRGNRFANSKYGAKRIQKIDYGRLGDITTKFDGNIMQIRP